VTIDAVVSRILDWWRPRGWLDGFGLVGQIVGLAVFLAELILWPPGSADLDAIVGRVFTLTVIVCAYLVRRVARKQPLLS